MKFLDLKIKDRIFILVMATTIFAMACKLCYH